MKYYVYYMYTEIQATSSIVFFPRSFSALFFILFYLFIFFFDWLKNFDRQFIFFCCCWWYSLCSHFSLSALIGWWRWDIVNLRPHIIFSIRTSNRAGKLYKVLVLFWWRSRVYLSFFFIFHSQKFFEQLQISLSFCFSRVSVLHVFNIFI